VVHDLWRVTEPEAVGDVAKSVASAPVVIADGHHRYEVAGAYAAEVHSSGAGDGPWDLVMALVVELVEDQLTVAPIHRLVAGLPDGFDLVAALEGSFVVTGDVDGPVDPAIVSRLVDAGGLALVTTAGRWLLRPRPETLARAEHDLDSSVLDVALAQLPDHQLTYQHGVDNVTAAVAAGSAQAAFLLRPATVAQIAKVAAERDRMSPKTTFFTPKPATGLVFRSVAAAE
ncbi:MAG TPA: DUF1015 family protein, partial [Acidimicrobiales bacterium]|nr:DUF1015 family protein [Acidimicrobiales bacterium]